MHELGIAGDILDAVLSEAAEHNARKVTAVTIRVGVLRGIVPGNLQFLFEGIAMETIAEGASLAIEEEPVEIECRKCGKKASGPMSWECPACGETDIAVKGGDTLRIVSIDVEFQDPAQ